MAGFEEKLDLLTELAAHNQKEDFHGLIQVYQEVLKDNPSEEALDEHQDLYYQTKVEKLLGHSDILMRSALLLYCSQLITKNINNSFARAMITAIMPKAREIFNNYSQQKFQSVDDVSRDLLDSQTPITAEHLIALFEFAQEPNQFLSASRLLQQFYQFNLIDNEENNSTVRTFINLFIPETDELSKHFGQIAPPQRMFLINLLLATIEENRNFHLALLILENIFPTQQDEADAYLLKLMKEFVNGRHCNLWMRRKIAGILQFALTHASFVPNSPALINIIEFKQSLNPAQIDCTAWKIFTKNNSLIYTVSHGQKTLEFKKQVDPISVYAVLNTDKENLIGILMSITNREIHARFLPEMAGFFVTEFSSKKDGLDRTLIKEIKKYLLAKTALERIDGKINTDDIDTVQIENNIHEQFYQFLNNSTYYVLYLSKALMDPNWLSITACIIYVENFEIPICFWSSEKQNQLIQLSPNQDIHHPSTHHILFDNACYRLMPAIRAENLEHVVPKKLVN